MVTFLRLEKIQFGGVHGGPLSDMVENMFTEFNDLMNAFIGKPEDPLNISNNVRVCLEPLAILLYYISANTNIS